MLKKGFEQTANAFGKEKEKTVNGRVPDIEWLFGYGEAKKEQGDKFLPKLLRRDWRTVLFSTLIYLL